ncbi:GlsB/YeaQ/YmgE family stress response membrane protein [Paludisphaera rhizosphaerae]|uniref:GlsB/YeaQ/YmgE family stress response membrane protein n=1 Tax=Paludisphaera rhizosphaerae TaxID=2711216 RepID=UPI0013ED8B16|nr:GlsB/YeaQ/YmgE family stress response membrane protein [Paludisphaera rhizosphaerae]
MLFSLVWFLLIGLAAGWLAGQMTKGRDFGAVNNMIVGVLGAILGGFLFGILGLGATNIIGQLLTATVGAVVVLFLLNRFGKRL